MIENQDRIEERAEQLVEAHYLLMQDLIELRKKHHLSQDVVGERMGISQPAVASFEGHNSNPTLSSIRRYALAVGARLEHVVRDDLEIITAAESGTLEIQEWLTQTVPPTSLISPNIFTTTMVN